MVTTSRWQRLQNCRGGAEDVTMPLIVLSCFAEISPVMTIRNLEHLFRPKSIAVIGASNAPQSVGRTVMRNLLSGGFDGPILPVNPKWDTVASVLAYPDVGHLPLVPDLAVICTPPASVPSLIGELGAKGTKAAIVLTAGFEIAQADGEQDYRQAILDASRPNLLRILGPNCVGLLAPHFILISAGFDGHESDPLADMRLHEDDYAWVTMELLAIARHASRGRLVSTLEGGYDLRALGASAAAHVGALVNG